MMDKPKDTCLGKHCPLYKKFKDTCPNFVESWWTPPPDKDGNRGQPFMVKDCCPKRTFLMIQELSNRLIGVQAAAEEMRNEANRVLGLMNTLALEAAKRAAIESDNEGEVIDVPTISGDEDV